MHKKISVIVPIYNTAENIRDCVSSLKDQTTPPAEIIVVDDCSTDGSAETAAELGAKVIKTKIRSGPGYARHSGAKSATGDIFVFIDADCIAPPEWIRNGMDAMEKEGVSAATGSYSGSCETTILGKFQHLELRFRQKNIPREVNIVSGCNFFVTKEVYFSSGGFQPVLNEDMELGYWLSKKNRILWLRNNGVLHRFRKTMTGYLKQQAFFAGQVMDSYRRYPRMFKSQTSFKKGSVIGDLISTAFLWLSVLLAVFSLSGQIVFPAALIFSLLIKANLLVDLRKNGFRRHKLVILYGLLLARDTAWIIGSLLGLLSLSGKSRWRRKQIRT